VRDAAARASVALLTNKPEAPARRLLDAFGLLPSFRWVVGGDGAFPRKPDPAGLTYLMSQAGAGPSATLLVGDSLVDVQTAERAGVRLCVASYGFARLDGAAAGAGALVAATPAGVGEAIARVLARAAPG
jgi:phosphoglycolate phosphatase